jgi:5-methylcytosine-specific restriction endonuclease McrA
MGMMKSTLVLNGDGAPVSVVPVSTIDWQDAIRIIYLNRANVLEEYDMWVIRSPSVQMRMPCVIMLREYQKHNGKVDFNRHNVYLRDHHTCQYCQKKFPANELTYDHVVPRKDGGKTNWDNIASSCYPCNQEKAHHRSMKPMNPPRQPSYWELAEASKYDPITVPDARWVDYLGWKGDVTVNEKVYATKQIDEIDSEIPFLK